MPAEHRPVPVVSCIAALVLGISSVPTQAAGKEQTAVQGRTSSADGVEIAYTTSGSGATALVFVHGGLANGSFWAPQLEALSATYRVVTLDLGGHGASGRGRKDWRVLGWAQDVRAVADVLDLRRMVLIGNSLGGPVALEAAALMRGRVLGVIGVDTLHDANQKLGADQVRNLAAAYRQDFPRACRDMVAQLFHAGAYPELRAWAEARMCATGQDVVIGMVEGWAEYDLAAAFRKAGTPIRVINGDLWPTKVEANRAVTPDFDAAIMAAAGHYPMLERPAEFNRILSEIVGALEAARPVTP
jgi:pimeloyl-ACP methyl ester carboxylesterase